jgi:hypothetical protein
LTVGSLASYAAEGDTTDAIDATNALVITIDKANTMSGTLGLSQQFAEPMTYVALSGTASANPNVILNIHGSQLSEATNEFLVYDEPQGVTTIPYTLTATVDPNTPLGQYPATVNVTATDLRHELNVTFEADSKEYDGTTDATVRLGEVGVIRSDDEVTVETPEQITGHFQSKDVDDDIPVIIDANGFALTGPQAHHYKLNLVEPTADIERKPVTFTGLSALTKVYDGTKNLTDDNKDQLQSDATLEGVIPTDDVSIRLIQVNGYYNSKNVANANEVSVNFDVSLRGKDACNYRFTQRHYYVTVPASISVKPLTFTGFTSLTKEYDGSNALSAANVDQIKAEARLEGAVDGENVAFDLFMVYGEYDGVDAGSATSAFVQTLVFLPGPEAPNYHLDQSQPLTLPASITPQPLTLQADPIWKEFDGTPDLTEWNKNAIRDTLRAVTSTGTDSTEFGVDVEVDQIEGYYNSIDEFFADYATITADARLEGDGASNYEIASQTFDVEASIVPRPEVLESGETSEEPAGPVEEPAGPVQEPTGPVEEPAGPVEEPADPIKVVTDSEAEDLQSSAVDAKPEEVTSDPVTEPDTDVEDLDDDGAEPGDDGAN